MYIYFSIKVSIILPNVFRREQQRSSRSSRIIHPDAPGEEGVGRGEEEGREEMKAADSRGLSHRYTTKRSVGIAGQENRCGTE